MTKTIAIIGFVSLLALSTSAFASLEDGMDGNGNADSGMTVTDANSMPDTLSAAPADAADAQQDPAAEQDPQSEAQFIQPMTQHVTSLQKCLDLLDPEDAAEVKLNPEHPYQECHARLADKAARKRTMRVAKEKHNSDDDVAESPRNFRRVQGGDNTPAETAGAKPIGEAMSSDSGYWSSKKTPVKAAMPPIHEERAPAGLMVEDDEDQPVKKKGKFSLNWLPDLSIKPDNSKGNYNN